MNWILPTVIGLLGLAYTGLFAAMTVSRSPRWRAKSRADVLVAALNALVALVLVHQFFAWWAAPAALWLVPVAVAAAGVAGAITAWPSLAWMRPGRTLRATLVGVIATVVFAAAVLLLVLR